MEKNKVKVTIAGVDYALTTEETPEYTTMLAAEIDEKMKELQIRLFQRIRRLF